jgi:hypothetical protein
MRGQHRSVARRQAVARGRSLRRAGRRRGRRGVPGAVCLLALALVGCGDDGHGPGTTADPGVKGLHRLNATEYNNTVSDIFGTTLQPANGTWRGGELAGFDNIASVLGVDEAQFERYFEAAGALATEIMASEPLRARFVSCDLVNRACAASSLKVVGRRLLRRPVESEELETFLGVYDSARGLGDDGAAAFTLALQALLSSAEFIYRIELDPQPRSTAAHLLGPFELAARLSYFLWSSAPDDALLEAAANGSLLQPGVLSAVVDRMLDDPKAARLVTNFAGQWLGAREVLSHPVAENYVQWTVPAARAASQEILLYFSDFLTSGRSWFEFPTADINFVDEALGYFYGIPAGAIGVGTVSRVEYRADQRAGFFGLAGFLAQTSLDRRTSPSRRGRWIAGNLLCREPPPPPAVVPMLDEEPDSGAGAPTLDVRRALERHRRDGGCAPCHALFDPYGLALEHYDAIGRFRATYQDGTPIDTAVTLPPSAEAPGALAIEGLEELSQALSTNPNLGTCLAKKLLTYGLGRTLTASDEPHLAQAREAWLAPGQTPNIRRLIQALVSTPAFLSRRGGDEGGMAP